MLEHTESDQVSIRVPSHKASTDYPIGSTQPLIKNATKSIIGEWRVTAHHRTPVGAFVVGTVTKRTPSATTS